VLVVEIEEAIMEDSKPVIVADAAVGVLAAEVTPVEHKFDITLC
jgi:hypothetical protein